MQFDHRALRGVFIPVYATPMTRILIIVLVATGGAYLAACALLFLRQDSLIYYPQPRAAWAPGAILTLPVDGAQLVVSTRPHPGPRAILYFGGNAEDVAGNLPGYSAAFPEHALYFMHYRGYGGSTGSPGEAA